VKIEVRYFASLVDRTGVDVETIEVAPDDDIATLWARLVERHPKLAGIGFRPMAACDMEYSGWDRPLGEVKEVAFLPPVSGG
jgi:molybdopterin converting factor small subunit